MIENNIGDRHYSEKGQGRIELGDGYIWNQLTKSARGFFLIPNDRVVVLGTEGINKVHKAVFGIGFVTGPGFDKDSEYFVIDMPYNIASREQVYLLKNKIEEEFSKINV